MKISNQNNLSFKSTPLHNVNVLNARTGELIPAVFSRLNLKEDKKAMEIIQKNWHANLCDCICSDFLSDPSNQYYAIELPGQKSLSKRIIGLMEINACPLTKVFSLEYLLTKPSLSHQRAQLKRPIKDIGKILLGESFYLAKKKEYPLLFFRSLKNGFYEKTFKDAQMDTTVFHPYNLKLFNIDKQYFDPFLDYISKTYKIDFSQKIEK